MLIFSRFVFRPRIYICRYMTAGSLESIVLCIFLILFLEKKSRKRHLTWHTEKETCLVCSLPPTCEERVRRESVALAREAAVSLGEMSSSSARQAGRQPRAAKENHPPPSCYRGTPPGVKDGRFFCLLCAAREQADFC